MTTAVISPIAQHRWPLEHTCQDRMQIKPCICSDKSCWRCRLHLLESIDKARYVCMSWINLLETEPLHLL